jgi:hypothetical protein
MSGQGIALHENANLEIRNSDPDRAVERTGSLHSKLRRVALLAVLFAFSSCLAVDALVTRESRNTDLWWHLGTGARIAQSMAT